MRFVLFSWPNPQTKRVPSDFRTAEASADRLGVVFGRLLAGIDPRVKVSVITFSLGAQIAGAALQELVNLEAGADECPRRLRVVHWSAAVDNTFLLPGRRHERAIHAIDRMLIFVNRRDPVNKRFYRMNAERPEALGYAGMPGVGQLGDDAARVCEYDATASLGVSHGYARQLQAHDVLDLTRAYVLWWNVDARLTSRAARPSH
jgi:hypothetical protein